MLVQNATPAFGGKRKTDDYYASVNAIIRVLRPKATLRTIASHLSAAGFKTPSDLVWNRERVANYLRNTSI